MSALSDVLETAKTLEAELAKFAQGELQGVKDLAQEVRQNLDLLVKKETESAAPTPPISTGEGVQTSGDLGANPPAQPA